MGSIKRSGAVYLIEGRTVLGVTPVIRIVAHAIDHLVLAVGRHEHLETERAAGKELHDGNLLYGKMIRVLSCISEVTQRTGTVFACAENFLVVAHAENFLHRLRGGQVQIWMGHLTANLTAMWLLRFRCSRCQACSAPPKAWADIPIPAFSLLKR